MRGRFVTYRDGGFLFRRIRVYVTAVYDRSVRADDQGVSRERNVFFSGPKGFLFYIVVRAEELVAPHADVGHSRGRLNMADVMDLDPRLVTPGFLRWELTRWADGEPGKKTPPAYYCGVPPTETRFVGRPRVLGGRAQPTFNLTLTAEEAADDMEAINREIYGTPHAPTPDPPTRARKKGGGGRKRKPKAGVKVTRVRVPSQSAG